MSSLSATQADGYYYPPGWKPEHGSLNRSQGSNGALGHRASKLHLGIMVVRFELPHNSWCLGCGCHIARGVRYNAEKARVGTFMTSPIHEFHMTCRRCSHPFVIRTDPEASDYNYVSGIKRKATSTEDAVDPAVAVEVAPARDRAGKRVGGPQAVGMERLEAEYDRTERAESAASRLATLRHFKARSDAVEAAVNRSALRALRPPKRAAENAALGPAEPSDACSSVDGPSTASSRGHDRTVPIDRDQTGSKRAAMRAVAGEARRGKFRAADAALRGDATHEAWLGVGKAMLAASRPRPRTRDAKDPTVGTEAAAATVSSGVGALAAYLSDNEDSDE